MALSDPAPTLAAVVVCAMMYGATRKILSIGHRDPHLPPGPPTKPLLGNLHMLPRKDMYIQLAKWAREYGPVYSLKVCSSTFIVLSSFEAVYQVMEKSGAMTANRPIQAHMQRIFGEKGSITVIQYGPPLRTWRRAAHDMLTQTACERHMPILHAEENQLMNDLLDRPENFLEDIQRGILSTAFSIIFGIRSPSINSPEPQAFLRAASAFFKIAAPGEVPPVNIIPILGYLPDRFARNWRSRCDAIREDQEGLWFGLLEGAKQRLERGVPTECLTETLLTRAEEWDLDDRTIACMAGNFLLGAAHTTTSTLHWFMLLAAINQDAQAKLKAEIDRVVGPDRVPNDKDIPNLPYLQAFVREVLRFRPTLPLALPHAAAEDVMYQGYLIPKGSSIFMNVWDILHDPTIFENPDTFNPDRFIDIAPEKVDILKKIESLPFGAGRRICPGMSLANKVVTLTAASLIWGFELKPPPEGGLDDKNFVVTSNCEVTPFKCSINPRSPGRERLIRENLALSKVVFDRYTNQS